MNVSVSQLKAFVAVLDDGGFGAAADSLGVSQSAVSHSIATLERALGGVVLTRQGRPRPTAFGERILAHARAAVAATMTGITRPPPELLRTGASSPHPVVCGRI